MEDNRIVELFWQRDEAAIRETDARYHRYLHTVAMRVLADEGESEECVNDTYLRAWSAMPPQRPTSLSAFLGRITRRLAIDRYRHRRANRRGGSEYALSLEELGECLGAGETPQDTAEAKALVQALECWLDGRKPLERQVFLHRYYHMETVEEIAARLGLGKEAVKSRLHRARQSLRLHLEQEGFL